MINVKKAITTFSNNVNQAPTQEKAIIVVKNVLQSYDLRIRYGSTDKILSFIDSIYTPTKKANLTKEKLIQQTKKRKLSQHYKYCLRYEHIIRNARLQGMSDDKISKMLNGYYIHKRDFINRKYLNKFRKERGIK